MLLGFATAIAATLAGGVGMSCASGPDGGSVFRERCARCHGDSGRSDSVESRALKVRPLVGDAKLAQMAPAEIANAIKSDPKHHSMGALTDLDESALGAAAAYVKKIASER